MGKRRGSYTNCPICGKGVYKKPYEALKGNGLPCCSYECSYIAKRKPQSKQTLFCKYCGNKYEVYKSYLLKRKSNFCSWDCKSKYASENYRGEKSCCWKGGVSNKNRRERSSAKWREWRTAVFKRDNYTCQKCGTRSSAGKNAILHPHHILQFAFFKQQRYEVSNGITLCSACHKEIKHYKTKESALRVLTRKEKNKF